MVKAVTPKTKCIFFVRLMFHYAFKVVLLTNILSMLCIACVCDVCAYVYACVCEAE